MAESLQRIIVRRALSGQHPQTAQSVKHSLRAPQVLWAAHKTERTKAVRLASLYWDRLLESLHAARGKELVVSLGLQAGAAEHNSQAAPAIFPDGLR